MKIRLASAVIVFLLSVVPVYAHQLDEYLQATTIDVQRHSLMLRLRMTPGVDVARMLLANIDTDADGTIADAEQRAYAERVCHDLSVAIDGKSLPLRLVSSSFPNFEELLKGLGNILFEFKADVLPGGSTRRLTLENHHQSAVAAYLVNCIRPRDPDVRIVAQTRNFSQSSYLLEFALDNAPQAQHDTAAPSILKTYLCHGVRHILTGYDHLLFISILVLGATNLWELVKVVTAFTLAHSITLTLATLNLVHLPGGIVEPMIAASIVFVAVQNLFWPASSGGRSRLAVAFFFGLFHGMGFAEGLLNVMQGLPRETVVLAILGFCVGVEAGHQMVLLPLFGFLKTTRQLRRDAAARAKLSMMLQRIGSAAVLVAGVYYVCVTLIGNS